MFFFWDFHFSRNTYRVRVHLPPAMPATFRPSGRECGRSATDSAASQPVRCPERIFGSAFRKPMRRESILLLDCWCVCCAFNLHIFAAGASLQSPRNAIKTNLGKLKPIFGRQFAYILRDVYTHTHILECVLQQLAARERIFRGHQIFQSYGIEVVRVCFRRTLRCAGRFPEIFRCTTKNVAAIERISIDACTAHIIEYSLCGPSGSWSCR